MTELTIYYDMLHELWHKKYKNTNYLSFTEFLVAFVKLAAALVWYGKKLYPIEELIEYSGLGDDNGLIFIRGLIANNLFTSKSPLFECTQWPMIECIYANFKPSLPSPPKPGADLTNFIIKLDEFIRAI
jgi:hypothetical protein